MRRLLSHRHLVNTGLDALNGPHRTETTLLYRGQVLFLLRCRLVRASAVIFKTTVCYNM